MKHKFKNKFILISVLNYLVFLVLFENLNFQKNLTISTLIFLFSTLLLIKTRNFELNINLSNFIYLLIIFCLNLILQNKFLQYETIDWDISSYLVAAQDIGRGYLPLENSFESKGPILFYMIYTMLLITNQHLIYFKILNDILIFVYSCIIYFSVSNITKSKSSSFFASSLFILLIGNKWYVMEFSEFYNLLFISASAYIITRFELSSKTFFISGILLSAGILVNQGSVLFIIPYLIIILNQKKELKFKYFISFLLGGLIPQLLFLTLYYIKSLLHVYIFNLIELPFLYSQSSSLSSIYELSVWLRGYAEFNVFTYLALITTIFCLIITFLNRKINIGELLNNFYFQNILISILFYFIAGHNYYHHLIYFLYFLPFCITLIKFNNLKIYIFIAIVFSSILSLKQDFKISYYNLSNIEQIYSDYPIKKLSNIINSNVDEDASVLALDFNLMLFYLNTPNYAYIIHPTNHFDETITKRLESLKLIERNNINYLISSEPDIVLCNTMMIIAGSPVRLDNVVDEGIKNMNWYDCRKQKFQNKYFQIDTKEFREDKKIAFNYDPYKNMNLYIKKEKLINIELNNG